MAKDVPNKNISSNNNSGNTSPSQSDQQKVPPLRIVLHTSGNQKNQSTTAANNTTTPTTANSTTTTAPNQQQQSQLQPSDHKREKPPDNNGGAGGIKSGGRVRIRLGTNRQQTSSKAYSNEANSANNSKTSNETVKGDSILYKEELNASFGHLRRITRRSHRSTQAVSNEDEESISSMTSTDENQNTTASTTASTTTVATIATTSTSSSASENATSSQDAATTSSSSGNNQNSSTSVDTPRRYKRRKGDTSEGLLNEQCSGFGFQNYMVPVQNSFELFKNIRKQVDKKLDTLSSVHPKSPRGFRDYMLARGAYLLHGNRLGNGTNLYMNEEGGLNAMPMSKFHALKQSRFYYSVPNRAKVPLGLPINSPLYDLFIEQEKERYRMRMQHIKEREKLTLAAEQEIMRVYNQAAMAAADQPEPFSACTMLKHQEIYNYMDSNGLMIQSSEEDQQDQQAKQDGVRTRRRQHEQIGSSPGRKQTNNEQTNEASQKEQPKLQAAADQTMASLSDKDAKIPVEEDDKGKKRASENDSNDLSTKDEAKLKEEKESIKESDDIDTDSKEVLSSKADDETKEVVSNTGKQDSLSNAKVEKKTSEDNSTTKDSTKKADNQSDNDKKGCNQASGNLVVDMDLDGKKEDTSKAGETSISSAASNKSDPAPDAATNHQNNEDEGAGEAKQEAGGDGSGSNSSEDPVLSDDIRRAYNKRIFLSQLQQVDDKWDKIRGEMLIRHKNEAESLHAVQKLEWEWKTKEIGACDVRTTPVIDNTLVPKLSIYSQDY